MRNARKDMKAYLRGLEREWWNERIRECENVCAQGQLGDMYKCLRKIGARGKPAAKSMKITVNEFKNQFERVSHERYEEEHGVIETAVGRAKDLREWRRVIETNELMNEAPEREDIMKAMKAGASIALKERPLDAP